MSRTRASLALLLLGILAFTARPSLAGNGSRPRNLAVSSDGQTVLITSIDGNAVVERIGSQAPTYIDVGAATWGVCMLDDLTAVVTHPYATKITVLTRSSTSVSFAETVTTFTIPYVYCTEVIPSWNAGHVLVANRGAEADVAGAEAWQHAVYEIDVSDGSVTNAIATEREPSALALSPDGAYLFVGHIQGALGGNGIVANDAEADWAFDGGSIVMFDTTTLAPVLRFAVGSPVRDVAVWPPAAYDGHKNYLNGGYRLYFTNVGDGAQAEAPTFGGRAVPNVISSIRFDSDDQVVAGSRQNVVFRHDPELDPADGSVPVAQQPAVLPEQIAFRWTQGPGPEVWELWVTNSASGTVSRADLDNQTGGLVTSGSVDITQAPGEPFFVVDRDPNDPNDPPTIVESNATSANATIDFELAANPWHGVVSKILTNQADAFGSNPRGIVYDHANDRLLVVTQFDAELVEIDPVALNTSHQVLNAARVTGDERDFFTFGRGFDFRETGPANKVNTISCGTCHPNGHLDGKVRMTVRAGGNHIQGSPLNKPVAVPSVFDVGKTEWIFFEGMITIRDADIDGDCNYCNTGIGGFFTDTGTFTNGVSSPPSPHALPAFPGGDAALNSTQTWGRAYFERLNCYRCHAGGIEMATSFLRTNEPDLPPGVDPFGPLPTSLTAENRFFHDPSQSFITFIFLSQGKAPDNEDGMSIRNMTDVGTRASSGDGIRPGVNTPALAGAWDNAPYMHDGRYRTLEQVLEHTWVNPAWGDQAAPDPAPGMVMPDNAFNTLTFTENPLPAAFHPPLFTFKTHKHGDPGGSRTRVTDWLEANAAPGADPVNEMIAFLSALSSHTDPCADTAGQQLVITPGPWPPAIGEGDTTTVSWSTNFPVSCTVAWGETGGAMTTIRTPVALSHTLSLPTAADHTYAITIDAEIPTCGLTATQYANQWCVPVTVEGISSVVFAPCTSTTLSWTTTSAVACRVQWGLWSEGYPNEAFTSVGTQHTLLVPTEMNRKYHALIEPLANECGVTEPYTWKNLFCIGFKGEIAQVTGIESIAPNPFNPRTEIAFSLERPDRVRLRVYDIRGRLVRELVDGDMEAGTYREVWDGSSTDGSGVASGVYFVDFRAGVAHEVRKITLLE